MSYSFTTSTFTVPLRSVPLPPQGNGRAKAHATSVDRPSKDDSPHKASPPTQDFYLDTHFSPMWMSGPHVFSFNNDGTVLHPKTRQSEPSPGHYAHKPLRYTSGTGANQVDVKSLTSGADSSSRHNSTSPRSYDAAESSLSNGFSSKEKPWKNVAITEEDEAAFGAIQAKKRVSALKETRAAEEVKFVYTWPPVAYIQHQLEDLQEPSNNTDENEAPQLSYASSAGTSDTSDSDEEFSISPPDKRGDRLPFKALQKPATPWDDEPLEKVVGLGRLRRRAPPPLTIQIEALDVDHSGCFLFGTDAAPITATHGFLSPLTAIPPVNSQLSETLLRAPYSVA